MKWNVEQSRQLYRLAAWSEGYVDANADGNLVIKPQHSTDTPAVDIHSVAEAIRQSGLNFPVLVRCPDILQDRVRQLQTAFMNASNSLGYQGKYSAVYPIKVNQQYSVVSDILASSDTVGLEAGSKSELMAVLGLSPAGGLIICNGYKDREYIRIGLIARKLGQRLYLVVEKLSELDLIIEQAKAMDIKPLLGVRIRLASIGAGNWQNTGGEKSKFGLHAAQIIQLVERLKFADLLGCLQLLHFHLGSQLTNLDDITTGANEAARFYSELHSLGVPLQVMDVGGGLGVDYEGSGSKSFCSMNYALEDYAQTIVSVMHRHCHEEKLPDPEIITECGRAMTAHHAFILTNVVDVEAGCKMVESEKQFSNLQTAVGGDAPEALYGKARAIYDELIASYVAGQISLAKRAESESEYLQFCCKLRESIKDSPEQHDLLELLNDKLAAKYFINLSIFQSLPDVWALDQIFPIVPVCYLDQEPDIRAVLYDMTCDSDGHIEYYIDAEGIGKSLALHSIADKPDYLLGIFLVGAYQEILGDMHNLFGDTDTVNLVIKADGSFELDHAEHGDRVDELLKLVHFDPNQLRTVYRQRIQQAGLDDQAARQYLAELEAGLTGYTYFEE
ncbi:MAG: biosynthetic arginine decarboxylase [Gammaproteobacteria bacterium]